MSRLPPKRTGKKHKKLSAKSKKKKNLPQMNPNICSGCKMEHPNIDTMLKCCHGSSRKGAKNKALSKLKSPEAKAANQIKVEIKRAGRN